MNVWQQNLLTNVTKTNKHSNVTSFGHTLLAGNPALCVQVYAASSFTGCCNSMHVILSNLLSSYRTFLLFSWVDNGESKPLSKSKSRAIASSSRDNKCEPGHPLK